MYLVHIADCIARVRRYTVDGRDAFFRDERTQDAVIRNLQVLAESTQRLSASLKEQQPSVDWRMIARFRNVVVHQYLAVDIRTIWDLVERELAPLENAVREELDRLGPGAQGDG
jgi:uncharacterized protein with HEPN domain